jgi:hypothetical protein
MWRAARQSYSLRWERRLRVARGRWKRRELTAVADRTGRIRPAELLLFSTIRDEAARLPFFLDHYRRIGIGHFLIVDNGSTDGGAALLADQPDVSLWRTEASYRAARHGVDWLNGLLCRHGHGHWTLTVDADELLVFPHCDTRPLDALTDWLQAGGVRSMGAMLLDLYPRGPTEAAAVPPGADPVAALGWFDPGNYVMSRNPRYRNLWIQGGPRMRAFFADDPRRAPALNKIPLVHWNRRYAYVTSTHCLLPRGLNLVYAEDGGERACGVLLHTKLAQGFAERAVAEAGRGEHFDAAREYRRYARADDAQVLWTPRSERYSGWRQLEALGLMSTGGWA